MIKYGARKQSTEARGDDAGTYPEHVAENNVTYSTADIQETRK